VGIFPDPGTAPPAFPSRQNPRVAPRRGKPSPRWLRLTGTLLKTGGDPWGESPCPVLEPSSFHPPSWGTVGMLPTGQPSPGSSFPSATVPNFTLLRSTSLINNEKTPPWVYFFVQSDEVASTRTQRGSWFPSFGVVAPGTGLAGSRARRFGNPEP